MFAAHSYAVTIPPQEKVTNTVGNGLKIAFEYCLLSSLSIFVVMLVMSNHLHIVVKLMPQEAERWSNVDVLERWTSLYKGPLLVQRWLAQDKLTTAENEAVMTCIEVYRERLRSISWSMKCLNEPIARQANKEDGCTGHYYKIPPCILPFGPPIQAFKNIPDIFVGVAL